MAQKRGLTYPLQIVNGRLAVSTDLALVEEQIVSVLETRPFERVMRSDYGFDPKISAELLLSPTLRLTEVWTWLSKASTKSSSSTL